MKTIKKSFTASVEVDKSTFIAFVFPINDEKDAKDTILRLQKENPKARHVCYAYKLGNITKSSDNGEPKGTAGRPLLDLIGKKDLDSVLIAVVRYFGGILLGAGRLLRTYVEAGNQAIEKAEIFEIREMRIYHLFFEVNYFDQFRKYCANNGILQKNIDFSERISLDIMSESDIIKNITEFFNGKVDIEYKGYEKCLKSED